MSETVERGLNERAPRFRFRFSLRWLFLAMAAVALWLGWNIYQLHQRKIVEAYITTLGGSLWRGESQIQVPRPWKRMPFTWRLLGEKPVQSIWARGASDEDDRAQIKAYFPEADIRFDN